MLPDVRLFKLFGVLAEALLALFAGKGHVKGLHQRMLLAFGVALGTVEPLLAAWRSNGDLSVEDVLAGGDAGQSQDAGDDIDILPLPHAGLVRRALRGCFVCISPSGCASWEQRKVQAVVGWLVSRLAGGRQIVVCGPGRVGLVGSNNRQR